MSTCVCRVVCRCGWLKARMAAKSDQDHRHILWIRSSRTKALAVVAEHATRRGNAWVDASAWGSA